MQHPALAVEHQRFGGAALGQRADVLGEQEVQPLQAVRTGDGDDPAVAAVDDGRRAGHGALFREGIAAVCGNGVVEVVFGQGHDECSSAGVRWDRGRGVGRRGHDECS